MIATFEHVLLIRGVSDISCDINFWYGRSKIVFDRLEILNKLPVTIMGELGLRDMDI